MVQAQVPPNKKSSDLDELQGTPFLGWGCLSTTQHPLVAPLLPYVCNFLSIGCDFTRWGLMGIETEYPLGNASSGDTLFRDTGNQRQEAQPAYNYKKTGENEGAGRSALTSKAVCK